ncbi:MAG: aldehyde dehydrogenase family protein [Phycisphaerales bacterium]
MAALDQSSAGAPGSSGKSPALGGGLALSHAIIPKSFAAQASEPRRTFRVDHPTAGGPTGPEIEVASPEDAFAAAQASWVAFHGMLELDVEQRAAILERIADGIHSLGDDLVKLAARESGFSTVRIVAERERLMQTLRMFAGVVRGRQLDRTRVDTAEPSRRPLPKPDLRRARRGIGPVLILGPANQPLTGGAMGADAASALAAGCPIICKSHPNHPLTDAMVARVAMDVAESVGAPPGLITLLHSDRQGEQGLIRGVVDHPCVRGVAFTGSRQGADRIGDMVAQHGPSTAFSANIGTINPVFVLPGAMESNGDVIAERLFQSCTNVAGQTCTRPSVVFVQRGAETEVFARQLASRFDQMPAARMRSGELAGRFLRSVEQCLDTRGVRLEGGSFHAPETDATTVAPVPGCLMRCAADAFVREPGLHEEVFGPAMLLVVADDAAQLLSAAAAIGGSVTGSIWMGATDGNVGRRLSATLEHRVGRLVFNATPTGLELCPSLVHGGPYPASLGNPFTSVGPDAAERWMREVSYQNAPEAVLPKELRLSNPLSVARLVNGEWVDPADEADSTGDNADDDAGDGEATEAGAKPAAGDEPPAKPANPTKAA